MLLGTKVSMKLSKNQNYNWNMLAPIIQTIQWIYMNIIELVPFGCHLEISIHHNKLKTTINFPLETNHNNHKGCYDPLFVNLLTTSKVVIDHNWAITKFEKGDLNVSLKVTSSIMVITFNETLRSPFSNFACVCIKNLSILKCFPFTNLSKWKLVKTPPIVIVIIINPSKFVTSACKYE